MSLLDALVENQGLELLVQNLGRLDEEKDDDARGVNTTLSVFENIHEARPSLAAAVANRTSLLSWLLRRIGSNMCDANKLYASELLGELANGDNDIQLALGRQDGGGGSADGIDLLLQACSVYSKRDPEGEEDEECMENVFGTLAATQLLRENQVRFQHAEGFELMVKCLRLKRISAAAAIKVIDYALTSNVEAAERLVGAGGLKTVFPVFLGRAATRGLGKKRRSKSSLAALQEHCIGILCSLALFLEDKNDLECMTRFTAKFLEGGLEKMDRLVELFVEYGEAAGRYAPPEGAEGETEEEAEEEERKMGLLAAGGLAAQRIAVVMITIASRSQSIAQTLEAKLHQVNLEVSDIFLTVQAYMENLGQDEAAGFIREKLIALLPDSGALLPDSGGDPESSSSAEPPVLPPSREDDR
jgi:beta-catenin-like protein 1